MKKRILAGLLCGLLLLSACAGTHENTGDKPLTIVATTYPVYLFTTQLLAESADVEVTLMLKQPTSCLHDYTLTVEDMKTLEKADVIVMNGGGLEDFMADALSASGAKIIDCSAGLDLLPAEGHEEHDGHDHAEEYDPHYWLDPNRAAAMARNLATELEGVFPAGSQGITANCDSIEALLMDILPEKLGELSLLPGKELITFHDGFRYLADYLGMDILKSIEEEAGSEASAMEIVEVSNLVRTHRLPAIFTEVNGSDSTAKVISRETGVNVARLNMIMSGTGTGIQPYIDAMNANIDTILEALG